MASDQKTVKIFKFGTLGPTIVKEELLSRGWRSFREGEDAADDWVLSWQNSRPTQGFLEEVHSGQFVHQFPAMITLAYKDRFSVYIQATFEKLGQVNFEFNFFRSERNPLSFCL